MNTIRSDKVEYRALGKVADRVADRVAGKVADRVAGKVADILYYMDMCQVKDKVLDN
jgi:hypothetical protein